jgi:hypothetical protein
MHIMIMKTAISTGNPAYSIPLPSERDVTGDGGRRSRDAMVAERAACGRLISAPLRDVFPHGL